MALPKVLIPVVVSSFPDELYPTPRSWGRMGLSKSDLLQNQWDKGGHFTVWERPKLLSHEISAGYRSLRTPRLH
ncbi:MAG: hypothetical protein AB7O96_07780 [Pseudobdellovibrionaceae bacterium]